MSTSGIPEFIRGDEWVFSVEFRDENDALINLTTAGYAEITFTARTKDTMSDTDDTTATVQQHDTSITSPTTGKHTFTIAKTKTNVKAGYPDGVRYVCDVQLIKSSGGPHSTDPFEIAVKQDATKDEL